MYMDVHGCSLLFSATFNSVSGIGIEFVGIVNSRPIHIWGYFSVEIIVCSVLCSILFLDFLPSCLITVSFFVLMSLSFVVISAFSIICKLIQCAGYPIVQVINKDVK